jgi:regulator of replication initiation timing
VELELANNASEIHNLNYKINNICRNNEKLIIENNNFQNIIVNLSAENIEFKKRIIKHERDYYNGKKELKLIKSN